jgi:hypothetical protein
MLDFPRNNKHKTNPSLGIAGTAGMQAIADQENNMWNAPQIA